MVMSNLFSRLKFSLFVTSVVTFSINQTALLKPATTLRMLYRMQFVFFLLFLIFQMKIKRNSIQIGIKREEKFVIPNELYTASIININATLCNNRMSMSVVKNNLISRKY